MPIRLLLLSLTFFLLLYDTDPPFAGEVGQMPTDFVDLGAMDPSIAIDIRYAGTHNFTGHAVPGYLADKCLLTRPAAEELSKIQTQLREFGLSLKFYDCYRPQNAVDYFVQ